MKTIFVTSIIYILIFNQQVNAQKKNSCCNISGTVTSTSQYCGGAEPSRELLDEYGRPKPMAGKELFVKAGKENSKKNKIVCSFKTDSLGNFKFQLAKGSYCIVEKSKTATLVIPENDATSTWDVNCLKTEYSKCDCQLEVTDKDLSGIQINFHTPCPWSVPCRQYEGPLPPSAPPVKE